MFQELLPDHLLKEAKVAADKGKGTGVHWPFGWGKKKGEKDLEAIPDPEAEVLKVTLIFSAQAVRADCYAWTILNQATGNCASST